MSHFANITAAVFAVAITTVSYAHAAEPAATVVAAASGEVLTLGGAKNLVSAQLQASGQRMLRPGRAEFLENGDVKVEIVTLQGLAVSHVLVHASNGQITDARTGTKANAHG